MKCPQCGRKLTPDEPEGYYNCEFCRDRFIYENGSLVNVMCRSGNGPKREIEPWEWRDFEDGWRPE